MNIDIERPCRYPNCKTILSAACPAHINFCGTHQLMLRELRNKLGLDLPEKDLVFIACHQDGCNAKELAKHLKMDRTTILKRLAEGKIRGSRKKGCKLYHPIWVISINEIVRVIDLTRNWILIHQAAKPAGVSKDTLLIYIQKGHFGKMRPGFFGKRSIHRRMLVDIAKKCRQIKEVNEKRRIAPKNYLLPGEIKPHDLAKILGIRPNKYHIVYRWLKTGKLPARKHRGKWVIKKGDIRVFVAKVLAKEFVAKKAFLEKLQEFVR